jgi:isopenicillin N synthase-like dioxygenase
MSELPVVDVAALFDDDRATRSSVDDAIGSAITSHGAFVVAGMPGSERLDDLATTALRFFDLPTEAKMAVASRETNPDGPRVYRGYRSSLADGAWAYNQMYDIGPAEPFAAPPVPGMEVFAEQSAWPEQEPCTGWRDAVEGYYAVAKETGFRVMLSAARWAGLDDTELAGEYVEGNSTLRLLDYPTRPDGVRTLSDTDDGVRIAAGAHTDVSGASLLWQRDGGLQAQGPDGEWHDVPRVPNTISVHLGTVLERMTSGQVRATPHRVLDLGVHRQSVGFFVEPNLGARLTPPTTASPYSGTYGWHLQERFHSMKGFEQLVPAPL